MKNEGVTKEKIMMMMNFCSFSVLVLNDTEINGSNFLICLYIYPRHHDNTNL